MISISYTRMSVTQRSPELVAHWMQQMPAVIRQKIEQYRRWQDAQSCLFGKALLLRSLQRFYPAYSLHQLEYTGYNRPYIPQAAFDFNISHSGEYIVCAISDSGNLGIDIEEIREIDFDIYASQFPVGEWQKISSAAHKPSAFYRSWTQLEALIKADGKGLSIPLKTIQVIDETAAIEGNLWYLYEVSISDRYACQLATGFPAGNTTVSIQYDNLSFQQVRVLP